MSRLVKERIRVKFKRAWRAYKPGDVIAPPAALREELLRQKDQLGNKVAEVVEEKPKAPAEQPKPKSKPKAQ